MRITSVNLPAGYKGLKHIQMTGMREVVLLAGPNGGGKSRLLKAIAGNAQAYLSAPELANVQKKLESTRRLMESRRQAIERHKKMPNSASIVTTYQTQLATYESRAEQLEREITASNCLKISRPTEKPAVVDYNVTDLTLHDWKHVSAEEVENHAKAVTSKFSLHTISTGGICAIRDLINRYIYTTHHSFTNDRQSPGKVTSVENQVARLRALVLQFLSTELSWTDTGDPTVFGLPIAKAGLSSGQTVLLQIALSLFFQNGNSDNLILLMDEPENHLHPSALVSLIQSVKKSCPNAQIWIATHSIHLLAHFDPADIWYVRDGSSQRGGSNSLEVLHSLLGGEAGMRKLSDFLALPAQGAALQYAAQCLHPPAVVDTPVGDPQTRQIVSVIQKISNVSNSIRVLDFGSGEGRLISELHAQSTHAGLPLSKWIDYRAYDKYATPEIEEHCKTRIAEHYDPSNRYFRSPTDLKNHINAQSVDLVILCNVLHEIDPLEWLDLFGPTGLLTHLLSQSGFLLVVEDHLLSKGERAHQFGFLILDSMELKALFGMQAENTEYLCESSNDPRYADRLKAHLIPSAVLKNASSDTRKKALETLHHNSLYEASTLGSSTNLSVQQARKYAFWTHQFMNATLAMKRL